MVTYLHCRIPRSGSLARTRRSSSATGTPSSGTARMKFDHIASEVAYTAPRDPPNRVVRCGVRDSQALSSSIVNATSARDSKALSGRDSLTSERLPQRPSGGPHPQLPNPHALAAAWKTGAAVSIVFGTASTAP